MTTPIVSVEAEDASVLLLQTLGTHRTAVAALHPRPPARLAVGGVPDAEQIQCQSTLVRMLSITESFAAQLLLGEVDKAAARAASVAIDNVWEERLAEARNAVAHGLGTLTRRQLRKEQSVRYKLKSAGISMVGIRIVLSDAALASAAAGCRDLIHRVDLAVQARPPIYR